MAIEYEAREWKDDSVGGTPIDAASLNRMEGGISEACNAIDRMEAGGVSEGMISDGAVSEDKLSEGLRDFVSQTSTELTLAPGVTSRQGSSNPRCVEVGGAFCLLGRIDFANQGQNNVTIATGVPECLKSPDSEPNRSYLCVGFDESSEPSAVHVYATPNGNLMVAKTPNWLDLSGVSGVSPSAS